MSFAPLEKPNGGRADSDSKEQLLMLRRHRFSSSRLDRSVAKASLHANEKRKEKKSDDSCPNVDSLIVAGFVGGKKDFV